MMWSDFRILFFGVLLVGYGPILAQDHTQANCRWVKDFDVPVLMDTLSIVPGSIQIKSDSLAQYTLDFIGSGSRVTIYPSGDVDSVLVCYDALPFDLSARHYHKSMALYDSNAFFRQGRVGVPSIRGLNQREEIFYSDRIQKSGAISRGMSMGNNQSLFVQSSLNLNLEGQIADDLFIRASITDQNIPFQPEGNTQNLQEFDNVSIQFYNDNFSFTAGDVVLKERQGSHFMRYHKNVQGGLAETQYNLGGKHRAFSYAGASVAKGKFASTILEVDEGVLGPYRIPPPAGQRFLMIMANSEKVYMDGELLVRGFNFDYVIDYNQGEITFTNKVLITQFTRIRIDYEYADQNYSRTITVAGHRQEIGDFEFFVNAYSEKDNPNRPLMLDLSQDDKNRLSLAGDDFSQAVIHGADSVGFQPNRVLYERRDTIDSQGKAHQVFIHSTNPEKAVYHVSFSDVGLGQGNYKMAQVNAGGRVFEWVMPINGTSQGNFEPATRIPTPNKKQMVTWGGSYKASEHDRVFVEMAFSDHDLNLFSEIDNENNQGYAYKVGYQMVDREMDFLQGYQWYSEIDFEFNSEFFRPIDRFRFIEFDRDWNYDPIRDGEDFDERILNIKVGARKNQNNQFGYGMVRRNRGAAVDGMQHSAQWNQRVGKLQAKSSLFIMENEGMGRDATWHRVDAELAYQAPVFVPGYRYRMDRNEIKMQASDSIISSDMNFAEHKIFIRAPEASETQYEISFSDRQDRIPFEGMMEDFSRAYTTSMNFSRNFKTQRVNMVLHHRKIKYFLGTEDLAEDEENLSGRIDWAGRFFDRHVRSEVTYTVGTGRELKREFVFVPVPTGEGTHTWRDDNGDGIMDLNEFYEAVNYDERNFIKIFVPTTEFVRAYDNNLNMRLHLEMPRQWRKSTGLKKFASAFSSTSSWNMVRKISDEEATNRFTAFATDLDDVSIISGRDALRSTLFFNRSNPKFGADLTYQKTGHRQLLTSGFESRGMDELEMSTRANLTSVYQTMVRVHKGTRNSNSDFLEGRNYTIDYYRLGPELSWQPSGKFRLTGRYGYTEKENISLQGEGEVARFNEWSTEIRLNQVGKRMVNAIVRWIDIDFTGEENNPLGYEMLDALRAGSNLTWSLNFQQKVAKGLQVTLGYEGRKSPNTGMIHTGRMQVSALF